MSRTCSQSAGFSTSPSRKRSGRALREPGVRTLGLEGIEDALLQLLGALELGARDHLARFLVDEHRDRHAPGALPGDHPVGALLDHAADAVAALRRHEARLADGFERQLAQARLLLGALDGGGLIHRDEPLRRVAIDDRRLRPPGMGVIVLVARVHGGERARLFQRRDHRRVAVAQVVELAEMALVVDDALGLVAAEQRHMLAVIAVRADGVGHNVIDAERLQMARVRCPDVEVVRAMAGRGMHEARAGILGHMLAFEQRHFEIVAARMQRMRRDEARRVDVFNERPFLHTRGLEEIVRELLRQYEALAGLGPIVRGRFRHLVKAVLDLVRERDGAVAGDRPRRRGPDDDVNASWQLPR